MGVDARTVEDTSRTGNTLTTLPMIAAKAFAAHSPTTPLVPWNFERRELKPKDILIDILYCGVCHSDLHQARDEWGGSIFPIVPGHEIVGKVSAVGSKATRFKVGDVAAVGVFVDSCRECENCRKGMQQYCDKEMTGTYSSYERDGKTVTYGGYSSKIVVDEDYTYTLSPDQPLERIAPLLCAGITTYSPIMHWKMGKGHRIGVLGLGGLGHMAVKLAASKGAEVTVLSGSPSKKSDATRLGAAHFALTSDEGTMKRLRNHFDFIIDTVSGDHDINSMIGLLHTEGVMAMVGLPPKPFELEAFSFITGRRSLGGSMIGGLGETQEMLDYCIANKIYADVEVIPIQKINEAYERMLKGDVKYRFVIDMKTL